MPSPSVYTESQLAAFLFGELGNTALVLGWDAGSVQVLEAVNSALLDLDTSDISSLTTSSGIRGLRALGRRAIWRAVVQATAGHYAFTDNQQTLQRDQIQKQAKEALQVAEAECREWDPAYRVGVVSVHRPHDPYAVLPDTERVVT